jgi:N-methylhydantoinase A/oxoprolinase/acetone carboxylase beta subunit
MAQGQAKYLIGVDTGGTYTDAAIIEAEGHRVIAAAKALTTKGDFAIGVTEAITEAIANLPHGVAPQDISLVSISTTLATNAVVEGHGSSVGVVLIGFDAAMAERTGIAKAFSGLPIAMIGGGHDHNGEERLPLDVAALEAAVAAMNVDAFAIAANFAVRNPAHEHRARDIIVKLKGKPVTQSTDLSSALDAPRRALTAVLNARLISRISTLIDAVRRAMHLLGIVCPLMIVKGDSTLALAETVALRPIETVLSGPAASLVGAAWLSGLMSFLMSDMGGTTTDIGILIDGHPKIAEEGANVGGWRTMVKAIDVTTVGLGGDSEVAIEPDGALRIGPGRIVPVSLLGARFPETVAMLESDLADNEGGSLHGKFVLKPFGAANQPAAPELSAREREILALVTHRPLPLRKVAVSSGAQRALQSLKRKGLVQLAGFTPSDAAHVLGLQANWPGPAALLAARLATRFRDMNAPTEERAEAFCKEVWSETVRLSARAILVTALGDNNGNNDLLDAVCSGRGAKGLATIAISPSVPIVAVGGPVKVFYPELGRRLGCEVIFSPFCDVANAVGAATGVIARTVTISIEGDGSGVFRVHGPDGAEIFSAGAKALARAEEVARHAARAAVLEMGAGEPQLRVTVEKYFLPDAVNEDGLLEARVIAEAAGRPKSLV